MGSMVRGIAVLPRRGMRMAGATGQPERRTIFWNRQVVGSLAAVCEPARKRDKICSVVLASPRLSYVTVLRCDMARDEQDGAVNPASRPRTARCFWIPLAVAVLVGAVATLLLWN